MSDFYTQVERKPRTEFLRLKAVRVGVLTDEQIAKMRAGDDTRRVQATLTVVWEPMSYVIQGGKYGNQQTDYIPMTIGSLDHDFDGKPTPEVLEAVRNIGFLGIPSNLLIRINPKDSADSANRYYERFVIRGRPCLALKVNEGERTDIPTGQIYSANEGKVFEVEEGYDTFPQWNPELGRRGGWDRKTTTSKYARYPVKVVDHYTAPESPRVVTIESDDTAEPATTVQAGGPTVEKLKTAVAASIAGTPVTKLTNRNQQVAAVGRAISESAEAAVLGHQEVQEAANDGTLLAYLEARGVITTAKGLVEVA